MSKALARVMGAIKSNLIAYGEGVAEARRLCRDYERLSAMSDGELAAMGISRGNISAIVTGVYGHAQRSESRAFDLGGGAGRFRPVRWFPANSAAETVDARNPVPAQRHMQGTASQRAVVLRDASRAGPTPSPTQAKPSRGRYAF